MARFKAIDYYRAKVKKVEDIIEFIEATDEDSAEDKKKVNFTINILIQNVL